MSSLIEGARRSHLYSIGHLTVNLLMVTLTKKESSLMVFSSMYARLDLLSELCNGGGSGSSGGSGTSAGWISFVIMVGLEGGISLTGRRIGFNV